MAAGYLKKAFDPKTLKVIAKETYNIAIELDVDIIIVRGLSGVLVAAAIAAKYNMPFGVVRKPSEVSHSTSTLEWPDYGMYKTGLIVDDFIVSGATIQTIVDTVGRHTPKTKLTGLVLYNAVNEDRIRYAGMPIFKVGLK